MTEADDANNQDLQAPLYVELEGALIQSDLFWESFFAFLGQSVLHAFRLPVWLLKGKEYVKQQVEDRVELDVALLPYDEQFLLYLQEQNARGRKLVLTTKSGSKYAERVADTLGIFQHVVTGDAPSDHAGNSRRKKISMRSCVKAMRLHQWVKNLLVFVPLIMAHKVFDPALLLLALLAFLAFGLCASSAYILNDLLDLKADRQHPTKRNRPVAAGRLSIQHASIMFMVLLVGGLSITLLLPLWVTLLLGLYYVVTLAYSLKLKQIPLVDVIVLAGLYTLRLITGGAAVAVLLSFWLLAFSMFLFLSLALVKRYSELLLMDPDQNQTIAGRNYELRDMAGLAQFGSTSGYISVLVLAFYVNSQEVSVLYSQPKLIWLLCPMLLFWVSRIWMLTMRGEVHEDPIVFALEDRCSHWLGLFGVLILWLAI